MSKDVFTLLEALKRWCDPSLVQRVRDEECGHTEYEMDNTSRVQLTSRAVRRKPGSRDWMVGSDFTTLLAAWHDLERDLRQSIERGRIHLRGVQLAPERRTTPEIIPRTWAADFDFDFRKGTIKAGEIRFGAIDCSLAPWPSAPTPPTPTFSPVLTVAPTPAALNALRPEDFPDLDDETVLALLEEHGRRVVKNGGKLIQPSKFSFLQIIRKKMQARAEASELLPSLVGETEWLARWIKDRIEHHQIPGPMSISRGLSKDYAELKSGIHTGNRKV